MDKYQLKEYVRKKVKEKKIVLFGAGFVAKEFYEKNKDKMNIVLVVSNIKKEWGKKAFMDEVDVVQYKKEFLTDEYYIVVCGYVFNGIERQLIGDGFNMYEDYIESRILELLCQDKKIALFYGQCVLRDIYTCLLEYKPFTDEYASLFTFSTMGQIKMLNRVLMYVKEFCDIYVYTPKILDRDSIYSLSRDELPAGCKVISISNLVVPIYWPQIDINIHHYNSLYFFPYETKRDLIFGHTLYKHEDLNINRMVAEGVQKQEILKRVTDEDYYSQKQVQRHFNMCMKLIAIAEKDVDITIYDFIKENYQNTVLFQNFMHPNKIIRMEYIKRFFKEINIDSSGLDELSRSSPEYIHHGGDVPIYPSVIKHLGLDFIPDNHKYEVMLGDGIHEMTYEEYMEHYIDYTQIAYNINEML